MIAFCNPAAPRAEQCILNSGKTVECLYNIFFGNHYSVIKIFTYCQFRHDTCACNRGRQRPLSGISHPSQVVINANIHFQEIAAGGVTNLSDSISVFDVAYISETGNVPQPWRPYTSIIGRCNLLLTAFLPSW